MRTASYRIKSSDSALGIFIFRSLIINLRSYHLNAFGPETYPSLAAQYTVHLHIYHHPFI